MRISPVLVKKYSEISDSLASVIEDKQDLRGNSADLFYYKTLVDLYQKTKVLDLGKIVTEMSDLGCDYLLRKKL